MNDTIFAQAFAKELEAETTSTQKCLERIPETLFSWKPHEKSMELGYLAKLVAEIPLWISHMITKGDIDFVNFQHAQINTTQDLVNHFKENVAECKKQGMQLGLYYSLLDWYRSDYPYETGRTGKGTGRTQKSNYASYLQFMKNQLTELLTNYGDIMSIWFDGHWDQTNPEGDADRSSRIDWKYNEIYELIHRLQPKCMIGNNHHLLPLPGEDFQMFERDLPGENKSGLSFQKASELPLETCETINGAWGYNITDRKYKTVGQVIQLLTGAAGRNANLLLNVGPMPNGLIQPEFVDTLAAAGKWLQQYGESIYGTRGGPLAAQTWGITTQKDKKIYIHLYSAPENNTVLLPVGKQKVKSVTLVGGASAVPYKQQKEAIAISTEKLIIQGPDTVIAVELK